MRSEVGDIASNCVNNSYVIFIMHLLYLLYIYLIIHIVPHIVSDICPPKNRITFSIDDNVLHMIFKFSFICSPNLLNLIFHSLSIDGERHWILTTFLLSVWCTRLSSLDFISARRVPYVNLKSTGGFTPLNYTNVIYQYWDILKYLLTNQTYLYKFGINMHDIKLSVQSQPYKSVGKISIVDTLIILKNR